MKIDNFKVKQSKSHYSCSTNKGIMSSQVKASGYEQQLQIQKLFDISSHVLTKITLLPNIYFTLNKIGMSSDSDQPTYPPEPA